MSRRRRRHEKIRARRRKLHSRKSSGWGMNLYRNTREGKIAGVAAGLADHWDVAHWVVRLMWVGAFLFTGTLAICAYICAWFLMVPRPSRRDADATEIPKDDYYDEYVDMEYDEYRHGYRPKKPFRYSDSSSDRLSRARERIRSVSSCMRKPRLGHPVTESHL